MKSMRKQVVLIAATVAFVLLGLTFATSAKGKQSAVHGTVVKVDGSDVVLNVKKGKDTTEVTIATDDSTEVKIDGKDATVADLQAGMHVTVPAHEGVATRINASTKGEGHDGHGHSKDHRGKGDAHKHKGKDKDNE